MKRSTRWVWSNCVVLSTLLSVTAPASAQDGTPKSYVVILPDPTPRPPDLQQQFSTDPAQVRKKQEVSLLQNQLRVREVWLEANQLLLLAQELQAEMAQHNKGDSMASSAVKAGEIEKLAKSMKEKSKTQ